MNIIYFLIPIAIIFVIIAVSIFFWAVRSEQFKDLERHGHSILFDDDVKSESKPVPTDNSLTNTDDSHRKSEL